MKQQRKSAPIYRKANLSELEQKIVGRIEKRRFEEVGEQKNYAPFILVFHLMPKGCVECFVIGFYQPYRNYNTELSSVNRLSLYQLTTDEFLDWYSDTGKELINIDTIKPIIYDQPYQLAGY